MNELVTLLKEANKEIREYLVTWMLSEGMIDYKCVSDGYIEWLNKRDESNWDIITKLKSDIISIAYGYKKDRDEKLEESLTYLYNKGMINKPKFLIEK